MNTIDDIIIGQEVVVPIYGVGKVVSVAKAGVFVKLKPYACNYTMMFDPINVSLNNVEAIKEIQMRSSMNYYILEFEDDWADEMDIKGFMLFEEDKNAEDFLQNIKDGVINNYGETDIEIYFGSNESNTYDTADDFMEKLKLTEISKEEYNAIKKYFPIGMGTVPIP